MDLKQTTVFELVGGEATFYRIAQEFYARIDTDPRLRQMFPEDLSGPIERIALFMIQYFGGPSTYSQLRGHPRLRMRHLPFTIGQAERDAWLENMLATIDDVIVDTHIRSQMREYFERSATFMINAPEDTPS